MRNLCLLILFLGLSFETLQVHALNKEQFGQKSERCYRQRKWDGSFDGFCGCYPWGRAFTMGKETLSGCFGKERRVSQKKRLCVRLWLIIWPWRTILNCINQITEEGRIVVSYCLNPEKNVASVLIAGTGNISVAGAVSAGTNDDVTWLVCKMIAERMNAHLRKDEEFKDGLRFIFELPQ